MPLVVVEVEQLASLDTLTKSWKGVRWIGLYSNDWTPSPGDTLASVVPVVFSGYPGETLLEHWTAAGLEGPAAVARADQVVYTHDGGVLGAWVVGYYVVDEAGVLRWAERDPSGPVLMAAGRPPYTVAPTFSLRTRFPDEG